MGWAYGTDGQGREIGYAVNATCEHPGCKAKIDRGLAYACGGQHGAGEYDCDGYFCAKHLLITDLPDGECEQLCPACNTALHAEDADDESVVVVTPNGNEFLL